MMNMSPIYHPGRPHRAGLARARSTGVALVIVLLFLVLITGLILAFFTGAATELTTAKSGADETSARQLADSAVQTAMGTVREATTSGSMWASQPGMIRTYNNSTGAPAAYYKLYSSDSTVMGSSPPAAYDPSSDNDLNPNWNQYPALYTDLNNPVTSTDGSLDFPIIDPRAMTTSASTSVQGFSYSATTPASTPSPSAKTIYGVQLPTGTTPSDSQRLPMPVQWLYVLADGSLNVPTPSTTDKTGVTVANASKTNPIVGRIAYWTDDETCKVNVNTASEATNAGGAPSADKASNWPSSFWDTPHFNTNSEREFGWYQPAQGEYQRYPGHPASVSMLGIFNNPALTSQQILKPSTTTTTPALYLCPRYVYGGSQDGTNLYSNLNSTNSGKNLLPNLPTDRLYASLDDVIFDPARDTPTLLNRTQVNMGRFFLTASSRASELNLFGLPRIAVWPLHDTNDSKHRTPTEQLIAYCSGAGPTITSGSNPPGAQYPFYFTRSNPYSATADAHLPRNDTLLRYLDTLTQQNTPGIGGSFQTKYPSDRKQILTEVFDYIRSTNPADPIFADTNTSVGHQDASTYYALAAPGNNNTVHAATGAGQFFGQGQVTPTCLPSSDSSALAGTQGFGGRFYRVSEASFHFVQMGQGPTVTSPNGVPVLTTQIPTDKQGGHLTTPTSGTWSQVKGAQPTDPYDVPPTNYNAIEAFFYLSFLTPAHSMTPTYKQAFWVQVDGLEDVTINGNKMGFQATSASAPNTVFLGPSNYAGGYPTQIERQAQIGFMDFTCLFGDGRTLSQTAGSGKRFPYFSCMLPVPSADTTMRFSTGGNPITVTIYAGGPQCTTEACPDKGDVVQTIKLNFPDATFPIPKYNTRNPAQNQNPASPAIMSIGCGGTSDRWGGIGTNINLQPGLFVDSTNDVLRSLVLDSGDVRQLAVNQLLPQNPVTNATIFVPHKTSTGADDYTNATTTMLADNVRTGAYTFFPSDNSNKLGKLWAGASYGQPPAVPTHLTGALTASHALGDWDNGIGLWPDGPWINQPNEGNVYPDPSKPNRPPYYNISQDQFGQTDASTFSSPNRMIPSPVMFGSLPTGVQSGSPWQTLLFQPGAPNHPGLGSATTPADHYFLDLFWMPAVEPYAVSEPFATAGKINLNQQLAPFTYITRYTGLIAALTGERVAVMPVSYASSYKGGTEDGTATNVYQVSRVPLNLDPTDAGSTLQGFNAKFAGGDIFHSASQICEIYLVPSGFSWTSNAAAQAAWYDGSINSNFGLVGDNLRERPYADIYNKVTTKSNTYTVHYWVQVLRKSTRSANPTVFDSVLGDQVAAEQRGAATFERYLDNSAITTDPATQTAGNMTSLEPFYRMRVQSTRVFTP